MLVIIIIIIRHFLYIQSPVRIRWALDEAHFWGGCVLKREFCCCSLFIILEDHLALSLSLDLFHVFHTCFSHFRTTFLSLSLSGDRRGGGNDESKKKKREREATSSLILFRIFFSLPLSFFDGGGGGGRKSLLAYTIKRRGSLFFDIECYFYRANIHREKPAALRWTTLLCNSLSLSTTPISLRRTDEPLFFLCRRRRFTHKIDERLFFLLLFRRNFIILLTYKEGNNYFFFFYLTSINRLKFFRMVKSSRAVVIDYLPILRLFFSRGSWEVK